MSRLCSPATATPAVRPPGPWLPRPRPGGRLSGVEYSCMRFLLTTIAVAPFAMYMRMWGVVWETCEDICHAARGRD